MTNALQPAANADITAILRTLNMIEPESQTSIHRVILNGPSFEMGDDIFPTNQKTLAPAFYGRILELPDEYQGVFLTEEDADELGRPDIAGRFCKSHYNPALYPNEADPNGRQGKYAEDGTECGKCPIMPFVPKANSPLANNKKCQWRGDILFQRSEPDGTTLDPTPWTLSMATTGMIELKGTRKEPTKGYVSETTFMYKLAELGINTYPDLPPEQAVGKAALALSLGGIVAAFRAVQAKNGGNNFPVVSLQPVTILEDVSQFGLIEAGAPVAAAPAPATAKNITPAKEDAPAPATAEEDDLPF
jgi:hypothetical protein